MPAIGKITLDIKDYEAKLAQARKQGEAAAKNAEKNANTAAKGVNKFGQSVGKAGTMVSAFGSAAGGAFGKVGSVISSFTAGPVAALTAAFGTLVAVGVSIWDRMTLSAEEYAAKVEMVAARADKSRAKLEQQHSEDAGYMDRLQELASKERLSNESKVEAANLIKMLTSRYGDLGISIDAVTGSIRGADAAQEALLKKMARQKMQSVQDQIRSAREQAQIYAKTATTGMIFGEQTMNKMGMTTSFGLYKLLGIKSAAEHTADIMQNRPIADQLKYARQMQDVSNTTEDMQNWQKVIDFLEKQLELEKQLQNLREFNRATDKEKSADLRKNAEASQKREDFMANEDFNAKYQDLINKGLTEQAERLKLINELKKQGIKIDETAGSFSEKQIRENIAALEAQKVKSADVAVRSHATDEDLKTWGKRHNLATGQMDGDQKQAGWRGVLSDGKGGVMTEVSVGTEIDGKEVEIPLIVPDSTKEDLERIAKIANGELTKIPDDLMDKAVSFARKRLSEGKSAFYNGDKEDESLRRVKTEMTETYWAKNEQGELQQYTRKSEAQIKNEELDKKIAAWQGVLDDRKSQGMMSQQDIDKVQQQRSEVKKGAFMAAEKESLQIQQLIIQGRTEEAKALKLILELKKQGVKIEKEEAEEIIKKRQEVASESYYKDSIKDLENQIQIQGLILEGKTEEAKRQQIINELKKRGLKYDEASVNRIMELNRQLGALNLRNSQKKEAESLYDRALRMAGRTKEADQSAALRRARDIKGSDLTKAEEKNTLAMVELTHSIQDLSRAFGLTGDLSIRTNDLTRRGGFQSGAAVPNISRFELLSLERMQQINAMLRDIRQKMNQFKGTF